MPVSVVDNREIAETIAGLVHEEAADVDVRVVSAQEVLHDLPAGDRERILERLNSRTTGEVKRAIALRQAAARVAGTEERRSGRDRRSVADRRSGRAGRSRGRDRRSGHDRRSGQDRRGQQLAG